jgi:hypothetical protein
VQAEALLVLSALLKSREWSYEQEWRFVSMDNSVHSGPMTFGRPNTVYFGSRSSKEHIDLAMGQEVVACFQMELSSAAFGLHPVKLDPKSEISFALESMEWKNGQFFMQQLQEYLQSGEALLSSNAAFERIGEDAFAVLARANALVAQGRDIINLGIGQPDFRTPDHIVEAAVKALRDGHVGMPVFPPHFLGTPMLALPPPPRRLALPSPRKPTPTNRENQ